MPDLAIRNYLITDTVDSTATAAYNLPLNQLQFANSGNIPPYTYTSLQTLMLGPGASSLIFQQRIAAPRGQSSTIADGYIGIHPKFFEDAGHYDGMESDIVGAEYATVGIFFGAVRPINPANYQAIQFQELRIRMLLDYGLRSQSGKTPDVPVTGDTTVILNPQPLSYLKCKWLNFANEPDTSEVVSVYRCEYVRAFGASPNIP